MLDLSGADELIEGVDIHDEGIIEVDVVEIDGFVDFVENADNHKALAKDGDSVANGGIVSIEEGEGKSAADDDAVVFGLVGEEGAIAESERLNLSVTGSGAENMYGTEAVVVRLDSIDTGSDGGGGSDAIDFVD